MRLPIYKYALVMLGLLFLATVVFAYFRVNHEIRTLQDDLNRRAHVISRSLSVAAARNLKNPPASADEEDLAERLSGQGRTLGLLLCNTQGEVVARSSSLETVKDCLDADVQSVLNGAPEALVTKEGRNRNLHSYTTRVTTKDGQELGALTVVHDASYINARITSAIMWVAVSLAILALFISSLTYFFSRRAFKRSVDDLLQWMKSSRDSVTQTPPSISMLKPVTREVEKLTARLRTARETAREVSANHQIGDAWTATRLQAHVLNLLGDRTFIVVSNREPYMHVKVQGRRRVVTPIGGLVTALSPVVKATRGLWVAHGSGDADREVVDKDGKIAVPSENPSYTLKRVWLSKEEEDGYYYGFSNEALWPLCHLTHNRPYFEEQDWLWYRKVNEKFADAVVAECGEDAPLILVQDYHFTLLPQMIRERRPDAVIGLFWHIPWPTPEVFQVCPWKREILEGMLGANFVGFHLQMYCNNFLDTVNSLLPARIDWDSFSVRHGGQTTHVKPFPISVQPWAEREIPDEATLQSQAETLRSEWELGATRIVVSVDRMDYTKGIPERLGAIDRFFEKYPQYREKVSFVQLATPSRIHIPRYRQLVKEVEELVDQVNWKHATSGWKPIVFLKGHHEPLAVYTFMRMADVCIVSSLADGMNLVAKEYVAARVADDGVLILSEFAGAARELQDALQINPYARADFAEAIHIALEMSPEEQAQRMSRLRAQVAEDNVYRWASKLIDELAKSGSARAADVPPSGNGP